MKQINDFKTDFLKQKLDESGYRTDFVAMKVGVSAQTLRTYLCGIRQPGKPVIKLLSQMLNCREEDFYKSNEVNAS